MVIPELFDVNQTAALVRMSPSWLYRNAGRAIPVTRLAGAKRLYWTAEQIEQIIRDGAQPARRAERASQRRKPSTSPLQPAPQASGVRIPQARPERSRRYRSARELPG